jgi:dTDP-6-deoxy-L-talose 4-dehydrogenase (NAD+)
MRVLLTGATGFVGRSIASALAGHGATVRATVRDTRAVPITVTEQIKTADLFAETSEFFARALDTVDAVVHAAWFVEHGAYVTSPRNLIALSGTIRLGQAAIDAGVPRFVGLGTCFEYDLAAPMPLTPTSPLDPATPYGAAKAAAYFALSRAFAQADLSFAWARLFYLHGDGEDPRRLVAYLKAQLEAGKPANLSSGKHVRDYMHVDDAGACIAALALDDTQGAVNICSGRPQSLANLARSIAEPLQRGHLLRFGALPDRVGDPPVISGVPYVPNKDSTSERAHA